MPEEQNFYVGQPIKSWFSLFKSEFEQLKEMEKKTEQLRCGLYSTITQIIEELEENKICQ